MRTLGVSSSRHAYSYIASIYIVLVMHFLLFLVFTHKHTHILTTNRVCPSSTFHSSILHPNCNITLTPLLYISEICQQPGHPLPVEIVSWDHEHTIKRIESLPALKGNARGILRRGSAETCVADGKYVMRIDMIFLEGCCSVLLLLLYSISSGARENPDFLLSYFIIT